VTEAELDAAVRRLCEIYSWKRYHTYRSQRSPAGFPDLVLVKAPRIVYAELKSEVGKLTVEQEEWLAALRSVPRAEVFIWRPRDLESIALVLRGG
jgi:hypothetical protein